MMPDSIRVDAGRVDTGLLCCFRAQGDRRERMGDLCRQRVDCLKRVRSFEKQVSDLGIPDLERQAESCREQLDNLGKRLEFLVEERKRESLSWQGNNLDRRIGDLRQQREDLRECMHDFEMRREDGVRSLRGLERQISGCMKRVRGFEKEIGRCVRKTVRSGLGREAGELAQRMFACMGRGRDCEQQMFGHAKRARGYDLQALGLVGQIRDLENDLEKRRDEGTSCRGLVRQVGNLAKRVGTFEKRARDCMERARDCERRRNECMSRVGTFARRLGDHMRRVQLCSGTTDDLERQIRMMDNMGQITDLERQRDGYMGRLRELEERREDCKRWARELEAQRGSGESDTFREKMVSVCLQQARDFGKQVDGYLRRIEELERRVEERMGRGKSPLGVSKEEEVVVGKRNLGEQAGEGGCSESGGAVIGRAVSV
ncbi:MAG: hypothetical protein OXF02_01390 [Simkaniaceae bacterium]|nr:hypothetical protein [Simkaniaceae bacterium]